MGTAYGDNGNAIMKDGIVGFPKACSDEHRAHYELAWHKNNIPSKSRSMMESTSALSLKSVICQ